MPQGAVWHGARLGLGSPGGLMECVDTVAVPPEHKEKRDGEATTGVWAGAAAGRSRPRLAAGAPHLGPGGGHGALRLRGSM